MTLSTHKKGVVLARVFIVLASLWFAWFGWLMWHLWGL